jgi:hypothetical protein
MQIASPCSASWDDMAGSDRVRYCQQCRRNVYNLSAMSRAEAEELVRQRETQRLCIRFYRRHDGTMLTADCPVGLRKLRRAALRSWGALVGGLAAVLALFVVGLYFSRPERRSVRQAEPLASLLDWLQPGNEDEARAKLRQARLLLARNDLAAAEILANEAEALDAEYMPGEDTPAQVRSALEFARLVQSFNQGWRMGW